MQFATTLNPRKIIRWLGFIALYLAAQSLINEYLLENVLFSTRNDLLVSFLDLFSVNAEQTIPTWYATILLLASAVLLAVITAVKRQTHDPYARYWAGLSLIFVYLSLDEGAAIHELFSTPLETTFNTTGYLAFAWLIVFVPLLLIFALFYLRFLLHLPPRIRNLFILAGLTYVGGAVIVEAISANRYALAGGVTFSYLAIATVEELLEMWGVALFIYALLSYMVLERISAVFTPNAAPEQKPAIPRQKLRLSVAALLLLVNVALISWAFMQRSAPAEATATPFYQLVSEQFEGQGVVILGINEAITADSPTAPSIITSLLTLFNDVMIVTLPDQQVSVAFASPQLPFDQAMLTQLARQSGEDNFTILDASALRAIANPQ